LQSYLKEIQFKHAGLNNTSFLIKPYARKLRSRYRYSAAFYAKAIRFYDSSHNHATNYNMGCMQCPSVVPDPAVLAIANLTQPALILFTIIYIFDMKSMAADDNYVN
jgi:hypothetical protein